jgi:hypothetical protein
MYEYRLDIWKGCVAFLLSMQYMMDNLLPVLNIAASLAGAFIAFHGVYRIIQNWIRRKHNGFFIGKD